MSLADLQAEATAVLNALPKPVSKAAFISWYTTSAPHGAGVAAAVAIAESSVKKRRLVGPDTAHLDRQLDVTLPEATLPSPSAAAAPASAAPPPPVTAVPPPVAAVPPRVAAAAPPPRALQKMPAASKALLKGLTKALHVATRAKARWHVGDFETISAGVVMSPDDFASIMQATGVELAKAPSSVLTTFDLTKAQLMALLGADKMKCAVRTWSHGGGFRKTYQTGRAPVEYERAEGKYSSSTSTMTLKVASYCNYGGDSDDGEDLF